MARILELDQIEGEPVGGKATGLARLIRFGLRVPEAVVVVGLTGDAAESSDVEIARVAAELDARFPAERLAVRSSAIGEDGEEASFAGQYESVLDVCGERAIRDALVACLESAENARSAAYRDERAGFGAGSEDAPVMSIVVQRMVPARVAGVCFTACPVTHRRNRIVIDAVEGLGEALVSGHASPDHEEWLRHEGRWAATERAGERAVLEPSWRDAIVRDAIAAEARAEAPLDLEWAIDDAGTLHWLQARPITTLRRDPQELDTPLIAPDDVHTRCNVGEMMPGAVAPLTYSTCARGIDIGWQRIKDDVGLSRAESPARPYVAMSHGHLFIDLSEGARVTTAITGAPAAQQCLAICGRRVPEVVAPPPPPLWRRLPRMLRQVAAVLRPGPRIRRLEALVGRGEIPVRDTALESWQEIDARMPELFEAYGLHLVVSAGAGALTPILLGILAGDEEPADAHHEIVAAVLSGAKGVESADIAEGSERILDTLLAAPDRGERFGSLPIEEAVAWLEAEASGPPGVAYRDYLARHGHRSLRELDVRQPEWAHDPTPIVRSLQSQVRGRLAQGVMPTKAAAIASQPEGAARFDWLRPIAHAAVRNRERSKSLLVAETAIWKRAYRALAAQLVAEERLDCDDAIYFLLHEEIEVVASAPAGHPLREIALERREAFAYQQTLRFPEVEVGRPQPSPRHDVEASADVVIGKPVSRGQVEGRVRVVLTLEEAEALEPGEILVAPITDVGWTPYFAVVAGLVTDVGSAVSHGAVVAREYGLPAVLNTRDATRILKTGERVRLDGDRGRVERLDPPTDS